MEEIAARGPRHGVSLTADAPPILCFEGIRFWPYTQAFHDVTARLRAMDEAGCEPLVGSDAPFAMGNLDRSIASIREFEFLTRRDRQRILGENAKAFLDGGS
jgi:hypothetical protein